ncbi:hypothetical protein [Sphingomicrobium arenosum]|uniref:hypothetical protein n=1 Tax=Sphingomicrobium arenosum TaxID=2233861 RepID=UPI00224063AE|nr:hypothetical protein [Sphingomicrobium arenosum]
MDALDLLFLTGTVVGIATLAWMGFGQLLAKARRRVLPMVVREQWTDAEYRAWSKRIDSADAMAGSHGLAWQAQQELKRLTDNAARLGANITSWRAIERDLVRQASEMEADAANALAAGEEERARGLVTERRSLDRRHDALREDIAKGEETLSALCREIEALEGRIGDDFRREVLAQARIASARDTIRARQLVHGTLAEAAMAKAEARERAARLAEAQVEALDLGAGCDLEALEVERDLDRLRAPRDEA